MAGMWLFFWTTWLAGRGKVAWSIWSCGGEKIFSVWLPWSIVGGDWEGGVCLSEVLIVESGFSLIFETIELGSSMTEFGSVTLVDLVWGEKSMSFKKFLLTSWSYKSNSSSLMTLLVLLTSSDVSKGSLFPCTVLLGTFVDGGGLGGPGRKLTWGWENLADFSGIFCGENNLTQACLLRMLLIFFGNNFVKIVYYQWRISSWGFSL